MRYLLLGRGSIATTLLSIIESLGEQYDITTCDLKGDNIRGQDYLKEHHDNFDAVINLTDDKSLELMDLCEEYHIRYIDAGFEDGNPTFAESFLEFKKTKTQTVRLLGFGMNPGIIEIMPFMANQKKPYLACFFETDLPELRNQNDNPVFGTWSPKMYHDETIKTLTFISSKENIVQYIPNENRYNIELTTKEGTFSYHITPHEEVLNIMTEDELCQGSAFIFHAPTALHEYILDHRDENADDVIKDLIVNNNVSGTESVGLLVYDGSNNIRYIRNISDHGKCCDRLGHNATSFQTACGIYVAMQLIGQIPDGSSLTFTDAAREYKNEILKILKKLDFNIEIIDNYMEKEEFEKKILPFFTSKTGEKIL